MIKRNFIVGDIVRMLNSTTKMVVIDVCEGNVKQPIKTRWMSCGCCCDNTFPEEVLRIVVPFDDLRRNGFEESKD